RIYKLLLAISFDATIIFYLTLLIGYFTFAIYQAGQIPPFFIEFTHQFAIIIEERISLIVTIVPVIYLYQSIRSPGVLFSTSEYMLTILPYDQKKIWLLTAMEKWIKSILVYVI